MAKWRSVGDSWTLSLLDNVSYSQQCTFSFTVIRVAMKDIKASLSFERDGAIFREDGKTVTSPVWLDTLANIGTLSEWSKSSDWEYAKDKIDSVVSNETNFVNECGPVGEEYIAVLAKWGRRLHKHKKQHYEQQ